LASLLHRETGFPMMLTLDLLDAADGAEIIHLRIGDRGRPALHHRAIRRTWDETEAFAEAYAPS
jgi:hypothetical protein